MIMDPSLLPFFKPRGIVVVGVSTSPEKLGYGVARNLMQSGYAGAIHFVGNRAGELFGKQVYAALDQVPDPLDLAILVLPTQATPGMIEQCGRRGIHAAIVMSSGFREAGAEGAALEQQCLDTARAFHVRLLGPNCIGIIDTHLPLDTTFLQPPMPAPGHIGFISQSGAFCAAIIDWSRNEKFGFSQLISLGNQADVNETDVLHMLAEDEDTHVIVLYMESVSDGRRFVEAARQVTQRKPVVALKAGRFESAQRAAASHTGALAASDVAFDAAFEKAGILRADAADQMFDWARALAACPLPVGNAIAVLTNAGGPGVMAVDALEKNGLRLAQLSALTRESLAGVLPPAAPNQNPVDMLASASPEVYATCLRYLLDDDNVGGALVILPPPPMFDAAEVAQRIIEIVLKQTLPRKPVVVALMGSVLLEEAREALERSNVPTFPFPERAASALGALARRAEFVDHIPLMKDNESVSRTHEVLSDPEFLLAHYGIEVSPTKLARSVEQAVLIAQKMGYPVVVKIASPDILHKSDVGGVILDIRDVEALRTACTQMMERVRKARPAARIEGLHLQSQLRDGQEVIAGAVRDPQFGPLVMFGSGGVEVEGLKDVAFALAPLTPAEALHMIHKTWAGRKLKGFRHIPRADEQAVVDVLVKLSQLMIEVESIEEIEINPLRVLRAGAVAVDIRVKQRAL